MNDTIRKFGYPVTLVAEYDRWVVLLREKQVTAGSLILACKEDVLAFPAISAAAFAELKQVTSDLEATLAAVVRYQKINYLMLMMVDPHVHFHVLPRHAEPRELAGLTFRDAAWPKPPDLTAANATTPDDLERVRQVLSSAWHRGQR